MIVWVNKRTGTTHRHQECPALLKVAPEHVRTEEYAGRRRLCSWCWTAEPRVPESPPTGAARLRA